MFKLAFNLISGKISSVNLPQFIQLLDFNLNNFLNFSLEDAIDNRDFDLMVNLSELFHFNCLDFIDNETKNLKFIFITFKLFFSLFSFILNSKLPFDEVAVSKFVDKVAFIKDYHKDYKDISIPLYANYENVFSLLLSFIDLLLEFIKNPSSTEPLISFYTNLKNQIMEEFLAISMLMNNSTQESLLVTNTTNIFPYSLMTLFLLFSISLSFFKTKNESFLSLFVLCKEISNDFIKDLKEKSFDILVVKSWIGDNLKECGFVDTLVIYSDNLKQEIIFRIEAYIVNFIKILNLMIK